MRGNQVRWMVAGLAAVGTLAAAGTVWLLSGDTPTTPAAARTVERVSSEGVTAKGTVAPISTQSLSFAISGTVTAVSVKPGDLVVVGQVLARLDQADAKQAVADAQAALDDAEAVLEAAYASAPAAAAPSPSPSCTQASSSKSPAPSASASSRPSSLTSAAQCAPKGSTSGGNTQRAGGGTDSILSAQQNVNNDKAALARAQRQLAGTVITSPVSGKVLDVSVKVGDTARSNVITLGVVSTMVVQASFSEADVVALSVGESATVVLPGRKGETYNAKITQIAETGTVSNNLVTYAVILTFDQVPEGILVGQSANVTVTS